MVGIPGGTFHMGSTSGDGDEKPVHRVSLDGFWMSRFVITNAQYRRFRSSHSSGSWSGKNLNGDSQPAVRVSWNEAKEYCDWLSRLSGDTYALPSEAQWEYACRAGSTTEYFWGNRWNKIYGNTDIVGDGYDVAAPVGRFRANTFGLHDMSGNVREWCSDWYSKDFYSKSSATSRNPQGPSRGTSRVMRSGSWSHDPRLSRSASRLWGKPDYTSLGLGFRVVRLSNDPTK